MGRLAYGPESQEAAVFRSVQTGFETADAISRATGIQPSACRAYLARLERKGKVKILGCARPLGARQRVTLYAVRDPEWAAEDSRRIATATQALLQVLEQACHDKAEAVVCLEAALMRVRIADRSGV
jgi:hypothetical protein